MCIEIKSSCFFLLFSSLLFVSRKRLPDRQIVLDAKLTAASNGVTFTHRFAHSQTEKGRNVQLKLNDNYKFLNHSSFAISGTIEITFPSRRACLALSTT